MLVGAQMFSCDFARGFAVGEHLGTVGEIISEPVGGIIPE